jgi:hypothetical protein
LLPVWRIALPAVSEKVDVSVVGHRDSHASLVDRPIPAVALPARSIPGIRQMAVLGHLDGHASLVDRPIPAIALPARSVRRIRQIAVGWHLHGHASLIDRSISINALPTASVAVRVCILRYLGGTSLG